MINLENAELEQNSQEYPAALSPREVQVIGLIFQGLTSGEAATRLFISKRTVDFHLANIYEKLGVSSRMEAMLAMNRRPPLITFYGHDILPRQSIRLRPEENSRAGIEGSIARVERMLARIHVETGKLETLLQKSRLALATLDVSPVSRGSNQPQPGSSAHDYDAFIAGLQKPSPVTTEAGIR